MIVAVCELWQVSMLYVMAIMYASIEDRKVSVDAGYDGSGANKMVSCLWGLYP